MSPTELQQWQEIVQTLGWDISKILLGAVLAGGGAYLMFARDVSFIKGRLTELLSNDEKIDDCDAKIDEQQKEINEHRVRLETVENEIGITTQQ